jgi:hypothetical protein
MMGRIRGMSQERVKVKLQIVLELCYYLDSIHLLVVEIEPIESEDQDRGQLIESASQEHILL